jgi:diguanylate cyclase (GGDEF)-like protein
LVGSEDQLATKYLVEGDPALASQFQQNAQSIDALLRQADKVVALSLESSVQEIRHRQQQYDTLAQQMFAARAVGNIDEAERLDQTSCDPAFHAVQSLLDSSANQAFTFVQTTQNTVDRNLSFSLWFTIGMFALGYITLFFILRHQRWLQQTIEQQKEVEIDRLNMAALTDNMTGVGNHRAYQEDIPREIQRATLYGFPLSLGLFDLDHFKEMNDTHGHAYGDQILITFANLMEGLLPAAKAYRLGGDEFAVLMPHITMSQAQKLLESLRQAVQSDIQGVTVSVGLSGLDDESTDTDASLLREQADAALYEAKHRGRNQVVTFTEVSSTTSLISTEHMLALQHVLTEDHIDVAFQPIWDVEAQQMIAVEALSRPLPTSGFAGPQELFTIAERTGHEAELDHLCIASILRRAPELPDDISIFINICPRSLEHPLFQGSTLRQMALGCGVDPHRIVIEITERGIHRLESVMEAITTLKRDGFRIALDDTGAGNSGLELLTHIGVDVVKVDREVVVRALKDRIARGVLAGILAIAQEIGSLIILEGIEDAVMQEQLHQLITTSEKVNHWFAQGYYWGRPVQDVHLLPQRQEDSSLAA